MVSRSLVLVALSALLGSHGGALAQELPDAAALEQAVLKGKDIRVVLDLSLCVERGTDRFGPAIRGILHPDGFMVESDHSIAFAVSHLSVRLDRMPVDEDNSFRVEPDGRVELRSIFLNAASYAVLHEAEFDCSIGRGVSFK